MGVSLPLIPGPWARDTQQDQKSAATRMSKTAMAEVLIIFHLSFEIPHFPIASDVAPACNDQ
jgi:hypothetical protein